MIRQMLRKSWPAALLAALLLAGCSSSSEQSSTSNPEVAKATTGTVDLAVQFPVETLKKALIDNRTTSIQVEWRDSADYSLLGNVELIPDPVTGLAQTQVEVPVGTVEFVAHAQETVPDPMYPGMDIQKDLEVVSTVGDIVAGTNTVILSFITGDWQFVDANDNPLPLAVGSGSSSRTLAGFTLGTIQHPMYYPGAAKIDPAKPSGWGDYVLQWYAAGTAPTPLGPQMEAEQASQFVGASGVNKSSFWSEWLNLTDPAATEGINHESATPINPETGDRMLLILDYVDGEGTITDAQGNDLKPTLDAVADAQVFDGTHITGHLLEMTAESFSRTLKQANIDCYPYWNDYYVYAAGAAKAASVRDQLRALSPQAGKAAPGDASTLYAGTITATFEECYQQPWATDGDGDGDLVDEYLTVDVNENGQYDQADGDMFYDIDGDGLFDWVIYNQVDGDGDGDFTYDYLTVDVNHNGRYDAADGDTYQDNDSDGKFDFTYTPGDLYTETEQFSNLVVREFRAKGSQAVGKFTPPATGGWYPGQVFNNDPWVMTILDASTYIYAGDGTADGGGGPGMEYGTYTFNPATGAFTATAIANTDGDWGPAGAGSSSVNLTFTGLNTLVGQDQDYTFRMDRLIGGWEPIVGSWKIGTPATGLQVVSFLPNGNFMAASYSGAGGALPDGMERGTYWISYVNEGKFVLHVSGLSGTLPEGDSIIVNSGESVSVPIEINGNSLTWTDADGTYTLTRVN